MTPKTPPPKTPPSSLALGVAWFVVLLLPAPVGAQSPLPTPDDDPTEALDAAMASARTRLRARDFAGAEVVLREALGQGASLPALQCALGDALAGQDRLGAALAAYATCGERARDLAQVVLEGRALMGAARLMLRTPGDERAQPALAALLRFAESHPEVLAPADAQALARMHAARLSRDAAHAALRERRGRDAPPATEE